MIKIYWTSTGATCTEFRSERAYFQWLKTTEHGVTRRLRNHPSVDLRDVWADGRSISEDLNSGYREANELY